MTSVSADFQQDYFALFGLPQRFRIDRSELEQRYRALQTQVHPDRFSHLPQSEQRLSMQWATRVNEAYQTLLSPLARGRYLLGLHGVDTQEETNTVMPADFLLQQMELRETLEAARLNRDPAALDALEARIKHAVDELQRQLAQALDEQRDYPTASGIVRKLRFMERVAEEISAAMDELDC